VAEKIPIDSELVDVILRELPNAPDAEIDLPWRQKILDFNRQPHSLKEKWDFIVQIGHLNCGQISSFVRVLCDLEAFYLPPES
jgi:hypothetical protein